MPRKRTPRRLNVPLWDATRLRDPDPIALFSDLIDRVAIHSGCRIIATDDDFRQFHRRSLRKGKAQPDEPRDDSTAAAYRAFTEKLAEVEQRYGIPQEELLAHFPGIGATKEDLETLQKVEARTRLYRKAIALHESEKRYFPLLLRKTERAVLRALIAYTEDEGDKLRSKQQVAKLEPGRRTASPEQWAAIGDIASSLALYLSERIPASRRRGLHGTPGDVARAYNAKALTLTAELMTLRLGNLFPGFRMTPQQVKSRIQTRRQTRR